MAKTVKKASDQPKAPAKPRKSAAKKSSGMAKVTEMPITHEQVAVLAHQFWIERGHAHGYHEEDWFRAERALLGKAS